MDRTEIMFRISPAGSAIGKCSPGTVTQDRDLGPHLPQYTPHITSRPSMPRPAGCVDGEQAGAVKYGVF